MLNKQSATHKRLKVLIIIENMSYSYDTRVQNIAKTLKDAGYHVHVICPRYKGDPKKAYINGIDVCYYYLPSFPGGFSGYLLEYSYSLATIFILAVIQHLHQRIDVLHICNPPDLFFPLGNFFQLLNCRFIYDKHDCVPELFQARFDFRNRLLYWLLRKAESLTEKTADHIITTNESTKKNIIKKSHIREKKITVVRNAPDLTKFPLEPVINPVGKIINVGYVGNMNPQDNIDILLKVAHYIKFMKERADIRFILIGNGSAFETLQSLSLNLKVDDIVEFTDRLLPEEVYQRLALSQICVQPDLKNSFTDICTMVKVLEYMALAKPIVAFDLIETKFSCGNSALYSTNNSLEEFSRLILKLADDHILRASMGKMGCNRLFNKFTWSHSETPLLKAYEMVTKQNQTDI